MLLLLVCHIELWCSTYVGGSQSCWLQIPSISVPLTVQSTVSLDKSRFITFIFYTFRIWKFIRSVEYLDIEWLVSLWGEFFSTEVVKYIDTQMENVVWISVKTDEKTEILQRRWTCLQNHKSKCITIGSKGKAVPLQAWSGLEGSRKLRFPDFMTMAQDGGKVVSLTHRPPLPPGNAPGTNLRYRLSRPQGRSVIGRILRQWKIPMTPAGIEPATFRFVAQYFNHCATSVPYYRQYSSIHII